MVKGLHTKVAHDFFIKKYGHCLYCNSGSKPVDKSVILEGVKNGVK